MQLKQKIISSKNSIDRSEEKPVHQMILCKGPSAQEGEVAHRNKGVTGWHRNVHGNVHRNVLRLENGFKRHPIILKEE